MRLISFVSGFLVLAFHLLFPVALWAQDTLEVKKARPSVVSVPDFRLFNGESIFISRTDTSLNGFQIVNPILKNSMTNRSIGNLGGAVLQDYFKKDSLPLKFVYGVRPLDVYDFTINPIILRKKKIFTSLSYSRGTKKEQYFLLEHKQRIGPRSFAGLDFAAGASQGYYARQLSSLRNFDIYGMYNTRDFRYRLFGKFIYNKAGSQENGGLRDDSTLIGVKGSDARTLPVWLNDAERIQKEKSVYLQQQFYLLKPSTPETDTILEKPNVSSWTADLTHCFLFNDKGSIFQSSTVHTDYFSSVFYDSTTTFDSSHTRSYWNDLRLHVSAKNFVSLNHLFDVDFFIGGNQQNFKLNQRQYEKVLNDWSVYGGLKLTFLEICALDLKYTNSLPSTNYQGKALELGIHYVAYNDFLHWGVRYTRENKVPDLFSQVNFSNHYVWVNDFKNIKSNRVDANFDLLWLHLEMKLTYLDQLNLIYYEMDGVPRQLETKAKSYSFVAKHLLNYRSFHLANQIVIQTSDKSRIIPLPRYTTYHSLYLERSFFKKALLTQFGIDLRYYSAYNAPYYQPAMGQFILQHENTYGDYLFADVFINFKVKTARFFFKVEHINAGWNRKSYMLLAHYPMQGRMFKFGLTWNLFD